MTSWKYIQNSENIGIGSWAKLIQMANGKYISIYHSDDVYDCSIVEKCVFQFEQNSNLKLVSTMGYSIDKSDQVLFEYKLPISNHSGAFEFLELLNLILSQIGQFIITPSVMTKAEDLKSIEFENLKYVSARDYEIWFQIAENSLVHIINEPLINYRRHENQGSEVEIYRNIGIPDTIPLYEAYALKYKNELWKNYLITYSKLIFVQSVKLNNILKFKESNYFLRLIIEKTRFSFH